MDEKKRDIKILSNTIGLVALLINLTITVVSRNEYLLVLGVLFVGIAALSYAIRLGIELSCDEGIGISIFLIGVCLYGILISAMRLA